jgi:hypothetical protein
MTRKLETTRHDEHKTLVQRALAPSSIPLMLAFVNRVQKEGGGAQPALEAASEKVGRTHDPFPWGEEGKRAGKSGED